MVAPSNRSLVKGQSTASFEPEEEEDPEIKEDLETFREWLLKQTPAPTTTTTKPEDTRPAVPVDGSGQSTGLILEATVVTEAEAGQHTCAKCSEKNCDLVQLIKPRS